ncbi:hypothetical protein J7E63_16910 [Bacillus sp. ISL-75]|uniref:V-type ATPase subunit a family protein n=1 Tax=Bacillus sp. ISL-75 TaxID=2819137 RepID=UPI001BED2B3E|nr:V-type ATPase subunit a family protein [Bacillus sp. ISL-75]MBT2728604.1 hypothetical protein [Bacillus sp. ISL-75]
MGFFDKLLWGASKRFANDASRIVANEMKKKSREPEPQAEDRSFVNEVKDRSYYLNELRRILRGHLTVIDTLNVGIYPIREAFETIEISEEEDKVERSEIEGMLQTLEQQSVLLTEYFNTGERIGEYTIKFKSKDVLALNKRMKTLVTYFEKMTALYEQSESATVEDKAEFFRLLKAFNTISESIDDKTVELHEELTKFNIVRTWDRGVTSEIDYND